MTDTEQDNRVKTGTGGEWLAVGKAGWIFWHLPGWHDVRLRVTPLINGRRLAVTAVMVEAQPDPSINELVRVSGGGPAISATDLRSLPLGRLEDIINTPLVAVRVRSLLNSRRGPDYSPSRCPLGEAYRRASALPLVKQGSSLELLVPTSRSNTEEFYVGLGIAYSTALVLSDHPVEAVAEANQVPKATVNRWLREARRLGIIAPVRHI